VRVNAASVELPTNQLLMVDSSGAHRLAPLGDWLTQNGFARAWGRELGVASAQVSRRDVESGLFNNIISWDRYASATTVSERLREQAFNPEIRQTAQLVAFTSRPSTRAAPAQTEPFACGAERADHRARCDGIAVESERGKPVDGDRQPGTRIPRAAATGRPGHFRRPADDRPGGFGGAVRPVIMENGARTRAVWARRARESVTVAAPHTCRV
jgi:hypothetical protein